ncbi:uncharacterized protein [Chelonus insularis]|uniref:uncharacterized protein n=1 Tax=Chelonus insularis TaxID=460826 RepID=UPI00158B80A2|nr:uncharacterized protein LOC118072156 [Chelonus insularis]
MDKLSTAEFLTIRSVKRKFMQWAWKWFYANTPEPKGEKPDVISLICLLQVIGFQLLEFEKSTNDDDKNIETKENDVTVTIKCGKSKMKAVLELNKVKCQCPNDRETVDASFWSVSGVGSINNINKLIETGSNLVPKIDKDISNMMHDVISHVLNTINPKVVVDDVDITLNTISTEENCKPNLCDDAAQTNNESPLTRCYTQPEIVCHRRQEEKHDSSLSNSSQLSTSERRMSISIQNLSQATISDVKSCQKERTPILLREKTWDKSCDSEPRPSPPKSSTPSQLNDLCSSLGEVSLRSDDLGMNSLAECLQRAKFYIEKAQKLQQKTIDDDVFLKPSTPLWGNSPRKTDRSPVRPPGSRCTSPSLSVKSLPQKPLIRRSIGGSIPKPSVNQSTKLSPTNKLMLRGRSLGGASPAVKKAVDNAQKKVIATKLEPLQTVKKMLSNSTSLNTRSSLSTSSTTSNNSDVKTSIKRYSTIGTNIKSPTLSRKKISTVDSNEASQTSFSAKIVKPRIVTSGTPIKKDLKLTSPTKLSHSIKK